jgi:hypothetical protein
MSGRLERRQWRGAATIAAALVLLVAFGGLAYATAGPGSGDQPASHGAGRPNTKHSDADTDQREGQGEQGNHDTRQGPPPGTHGYDVSKVAHATPPGPGHGQAVSAVARSRDGNTHPKHAKHGHHSNSAASDD